MTQALVQEQTLDELVATLNPDLEYLEAELLGIEAEMGITNSCICTFTCNNGPLKEVLS